MYRVIFNSLTHFLKLVHLYGRKDCNTWHTDGKRNSASFCSYLVSALCAHTLWHGGCQGDNRFLPIPVATCHDWFMRVQWWFIFAAAGSGAGLPYLQGHHIFQWIQYLLQSNLVITPWKGLNILCCYKQVLL